MPFEIENFIKFLNIDYFMTESTISNRFSQKISDEVINELITKVFVEQPLVLPGSANDIDLTLLLRYFYSNYNCSQ